MPTGFPWEFTTQYQKNQWEDMEYKGRQYTAALYDKVNDQIARITFNRPEKRNALDDKMYNDFLAGLHQANDDPAVRVVIIRANGASYGSGHELSSPKGNDSPPIHPSENPTMVDYYGLERRRCGKYEDIMHYPKITIGQVHGNCLGAHEIITRSFDFVIASDDAQFGMRAFGTRPFGINRWTGFWPAESQKMFGGQYYQETSVGLAENVGLINAVVPRDKLEAEALKWAEMCCSINPDALTVAKEWLGGMMDINGLGTSYRSHYIEHNILQYVRFHSDETNFYKSKSGKGVSGYIKERTSRATKDDKE